MSNVLDLVDQTFFLGDRVDSIAAHANSSAHMT